MSSLPEPLDLRSSRAPFRGFSRWRRARLRARNGAAEHLDAGPVGALFTEHAALLVAARDADHPVLAQVFRDRAKRLRARLAAGDAPSATRDR